MSRQGRDQENTGGGGQHAIDEGEHPDGRANAQGDSRDRDGRERGGSAQASNAVNDVTPCVIEPPERTSIPLGLLHHFHAAEQTPGGGTRLVRRHPLVAKILLDEGKVGGDFTRQLLFGARRPEHIEHPREPSAERGRGLSLLREQPIDQAGEPPPSLGLLRQRPRAGFRDAVVLGVAIVLRLPPGGLIQPFCSRRTSTG
jgi:hypothetical protein